MSICADKRVELETLITEEDEYLKGFEKRDNWARLVCAILSVTIVVGSITLVVLNFEAFGG